MTLPGYLGTLERADIPILVLYKGSVNTGMHSLLNDSFVVRVLGVISHIWLFDCLTVFRFVFPRQMA